MQQSLGDMGVGAGVSWEQAPPSQCSLTLHSELKTPHLSKTPTVTCPQPPSCSQMVNYKWQQYYMPQKEVSLMAGASLK